ncbi:MAG: phage tail sheath family protein [Isosphaerales bacterium]
MAITVSYPGVYIEEIPSGVRTITGVATSIAAFVGWAPQGAVGSAVLVLSWPDFTRQFGGLDTRSYLGYAVYQFFSNGGTQAYIIRIVGPGNLAATVTLGGVLTLTAQSPGLWGNSYGVTVTNLATPGRFRLQTFNLPPNNAPAVLVESFENLSMSSSDSRYVQNIVSNQSSFITATVIGNNPSPPANNTTPTPLTGGLDGTLLQPASTSASAAGAFETAVLPGSGVGVDLLEHVDLFNILCVPGEADPGTLGKLEAFCQGHRAMLIADCYQDATFNSLSGSGPNSALTQGDPPANAAFYFPWISAQDPLLSNLPNTFPPCGFVAGIWAQTDGTRGVWKAPAGTAASLTGAIGVYVPLNDRENGVLNPFAVNCIRNFNVYGTIVWGARTLQGNDQLGSEWKYIPVRRTALFIEESLFRALKWVVFEPNDEPLWSQIRLNVGAFMQNLFRQGAFQGQTPTDAYFVKCDKETTTQNDINLGIVNIVVGFAPLKPAEFVVIQIQQMAGQIAT